MEGRVRRAGGEDPGNTTRLRVTLETSAAVHGHLAVSLLAEDEGCVRGQRRNVQGSAVPREFSVCDRRRPFEQEAVPGSFKENPLLSPAGGAGAN